jgi:hypothetical protein
MHAAYGTVTLYGRSWWPVGLPTGHHDYSTEQTHATNIHALSGIRTLNPSNRAASDLRQFSLK